jgi:pseudooxynicotine oxidase
MAKKNKKQFPRASGALKKAVEGVTVQGARKISIRRADDNYDVVIIGAGFAGAIAARELSKAGMRTLILEARERPGGRTFNADFNGARLEMGGTWIHWGNRISGQKCDVMV